MRYTRSQLQGADLILLLDLTVRGALFRYSTQREAIPSGDDTLIFLSGLADVSLNDGIEPLQETGGKTLSIALHFLTSSGGSWAALASGDHDLGDTSAEVSIIRSGDDYSQRQILISGRVEEPTYGSIYEPVTFTIIDGFLDSPSLLPPSGEIIDDQTWPNRANPSGGLKTDDGVYGTFYPYVFGRVGYRPQGAVYVDHPAYPVAITGVDILHGGNLQANGTAAQDVEVLIGAHRFKDTKARIYNMSRKLEGSSIAQQYYDEFDITYQTDSRGREVAICSVNGSGGPPYLPIYAGDQIYCSLHQGGGGIKNPATGSAMRGGGEILIYLCQRANLQMSPTSDLLKSRLNDYKFDFVINSPASPIDIMRSYLLPYLPVSLIEASSGVELVYWDIYAKNTDAIDHINPAQQGGGRIGAVSFSSVSDIKNRITIQYAKRGDSGVYLRSLTYTKREETGALSSSSDGGSKVQANPYADASQRRYGLREEIIEAPSIQDTKTAGAVLDFLIRWHSQTRRICSYSLPLHYQYLRAGDLILWTDEEISLSSALCFVTNVRRGVSDTEITIQTIPDWVKDF